MSDLLRINDLFKQKKYSEIIEIAPSSIDGGNITLETRYILSVSFLHSGKYLECLEQAWLIWVQSEEEMARNESIIVDIIRSIVIHFINKYSEYEIDLVANIFRHISKFVESSLLLRREIELICEYFSDIAFNENDIGRYAEYMRIFLIASPHSLNFYEKIVATTVDEQLFIDFLESQCAGSDFISRYTEKVMGSCKSYLSENRLIFLSRYHSHVDWAKRNGYELEKFSDAEFVDVTFSSLAFRNPGPFKVLLSEGQLIHAHDVVVTTGASGMFFSKAGDTFSFRQIGDHPTSPRNPAFSLCSGDQFLVDIPKPRKTISETCFLASYEDIYYHFLLDCGPTLRAYKERYDGSGIPLVFFSSSPKRCEQFVRYLGISAPIIVAPDWISLGFSKLIIPAGRYQIFSETAWFTPAAVPPSPADDSATQMGGIGTTRFSWRSLSADKQSSGIIECSVSKHVMSRVDIEFIRRNALLKYHTGRTEKIFITRRDVTLRKIEGEEELSARLEALGFKIVCPGEMDFLDQIKLFANADIIVAQHGGALANIVFAPAGATLLELQFPSLGRFPNAICVLAHLVGLRHHDIAFAGQRVDVGKVLDALAELAQGEPS